MRRTHHNTCNDGDNNVVKPDGEYPYAEAEHNDGENKVASAEGDFADAKGLAGSKRLGFGHVDGPELLWLYGLVMSRCIDLSWGWFLGHICLGRLICCCC